jgi:hypothetical protein
MFFPRSVFLTNRYDTEYRVIADWDLNLRCFIDQGYGFKYIQELVAIYNDIDGLSAREHRTAIKEYRAIMRKRLGFSGLFYSSRMSLLGLLEVLRCKEPLRKLYISVTDAIRQTFWPDTDSRQSASFHLLPEETSTTRKYESKLRELGF